MSIGINLHTCMGTITIQTNMKIENRKPGYLA